MVGLDIYLQEARAAGKQTIQCGIIPQTRLIDWIWPNIYETSKGHTLLR